MFLAPTVAALGVLTALLIGERELSQEFSKAVAAEEQELTANTSYTLYTPESDHVTPSECTVRDPRGHSLELTRGYGTTQTTPDETAFTDTAVFTTQESGTHTVSCENSFETVVITASGYSTIRSASFVSVAAALIIGCVGIALIVLNRISVARRKSR